MVVILFIQYRLFLLTFHPQDAKKQRKELKRLRREARDAKAEGTVVVRVLGEGTANVHGPNVCATSTLL